MWDHFTHHFIGNEIFLEMCRIEENITQVPGIITPVEGIGVIPIYFLGSKYLYLLYPCYHMHNNPQVTI